MIPSSTRIVAPFIRMKETATSRVGAIRVRPVSTTKVRKASNSARPIANGASSRRRDHPLGSMAVGSNGAAELSTLVIPANGGVKEKVRPCGTDAFIPHCCRSTTVRNSHSMSIAYRFQELVLATIRQIAKTNVRCNPRLKLVAVAQGKPDLSRPQGRRGRRSGWGDKMTEMKNGPGTHHQCRGH